MAKVALMLALAGCNQVYGLEQTHLADARDPFFGSPSLFDPYLVGDCSRLYFAAVRPRASTTWRPSSVTMGHSMKACVESQGFCEVVCNSP